MKTLTVSPSRVTCPINHQLFSELLAMNPTTPWHEFAALWRDPVQQRLQQLLQQDTSSEPGIQRLQEAMRYAVLGSGKRLRPLTALAAAVAVGARPDVALDAACALEFIHCYSLIHDDLPGMDDDELRRGRQTVHVAFDEATAILAGDALLTAAFGLVARQRHAGALVAELASASGAAGMVGGQAMDIAMEGIAADPDLVLTMYARKTGALIGAACALGAICGDADQAVVDRLRTFGVEVGKLFQVADDLLGLVGDPAATGKPVGRDTERQKATLIAMLDESRARHRAQELLDQALGLLDNSPVLAGMAHYAWQRST